MRRRQLNNLGFAPVLIIVLLVVLGVGFLVSREFIARANRAQQVAQDITVTTKATKVSSFDDCAALKDSVIKTGPASCTTKDGRSFARQATVKTSLEITPWRIRIPLTPVISDAYFIALSDGTIRISSDQLEIALASLKGCRAGFENLEYTRAQPGNIYNGTAYTIVQLEALATKVGDYYYFPVVVNSPACTLEANALNEEAANLRLELQAAFKRAEAY